MAFLATLLLLCNLAQAAPTLNFPVNSQVPPVAKVSEAFEFVFSDSTFTSSAPSISYSLVGPPQWLRLDSQTRTLSGTPNSNDIGASTFELSATDGDGSISATVTLIVTQDAETRPGAPLLPQLEKFGRTSSPATLFLRPADPFFFNFSQDTFVATSSKTVYYAISSDNSPLPSWISFDSQSLNFSGLTPPLISPMATPEPYGIKLIGSDIPGFASATADFQIIVADRILAFNTSLVRFNVSEGAEFTSPPLRDSLFLDGKPVENGQFVQIGGDIPDWLSLDRETLTLSGTPPQNATDVNATFPVVDTFGDTCSITVALHIHNTLFSGKLPSAKATPGQDFNYTISQSFLSEPSVRLAVDLGTTASWLKYDSVTMKLSGRVPNNLSPQNITINLVASLGKSVETEPLVLSIISGTGVLPSMTTKPVPSSAPSQSPEPKATITHSQISNKKRNIIIISVVIPVVVLFLLLLLLLCCLKRRKKHRLSISKPGPLIQSSQPDIEPPMNQRVLSEPQRLQTPSRISAFDLNNLLAHDTIRASRFRARRRTGTEEGAVVTPDAEVPHALGGDSGEHLESPLPLYKQHSQDLTPFRRENRNYSRKRAPLYSMYSSENDPSPTRMRDSKLSRRASSRLSALPGSNRLSGANRLSGFGHGSGGLGPPGYGNVRRSWKDARSSFTMPNDEGKARSMESMIHSFPQPPAGDADAPVEDRVERKRASIRLVNEPSFLRSSHTSQFPEYIRNRAQSRQSSNPLFSAGGRGSLRRPSLSPVVPEQNWSQMGDGKRFATRSSSKSSSMGPSRHSTRSSRRNLGTRVGEGITRWANIMSQGSLSSNGRFDSAESEELNDSDEEIIEGLDADGRPRWFKGSDVGYPQGLKERPANVSTPTWEGPQPIKDQTLHPPGGGASPRRHRFSPLTAHPHDGEPFGAPSAEKKLKLFDGKGKRPTSVEDDGAQRAIGSQKGDIAFL